MRAAALRAGIAETPRDFRGQRRLGAGGTPCVRLPLSPLLAPWPPPSTDPPLNPAPWRISTCDRGKSSVASSSRICRPASRSGRGTFRECCRSRCPRLPCAMSCRISRNSASSMLLTPAPAAFPTQHGLRFFVDALLEFGDLGREERARIDSQVRAAAEGGGFEGRSRRDDELALRSDARGRRGADHQERSQAEARRIRAART